MPFVKPIAQEITLQSKTGLRAAFSRYGAAVTALYVPDRNGRMQNIVYADPEAFGGQIIAPIAGRIRGGKVPIHGKIWQMPCDSQEIAQHSGPENTARHIWTLAEQNADTVIFSTRLADGICGLPGNRVCTAMYRLRENCLELDIAIKTDQDTFVNPTSHLYWNLAGDFSHPIEGQLLQFSAPKYGTMTHSICHKKSIPLQVRFLILRTLEHGNLCQKVKNSCRSPMGIIMLFS